MLEPTCDTNRQRQRQPENRTISPKNAQQSRQHSSTTKCPSVGRPQPQCGGREASLEIIIVPVCREEGQNNSKFISLSFSPCLQQCFVSETPLYWVTSPSQCIHSSASLGELCKPSLSPNMSTASLQVSDPPLVLESGLLLFVVDYN